MLVVSDSSMGNTQPIFVQSKTNSNLKVLYPTKKIKRGLSSFHPKITISRFADRLRLVIGSGNLASGDWLFWVNCFAVMDFPKRASKKPNGRVVKPVHGVLSGGHDHSADRNSGASAKSLVEQRFWHDLSSHFENIRKCGYGFEEYLREYTQRILCDKVDQLDEFLDIDFDDYRLEQDEVYLVGSLPGAYANHMNYSAPSILKLGKHGVISESSYLPDQDEEASEIDPFNKENIRAVIGHHSTRFANLICNNGKSSAKSIHIQEMKRVTPKKSRTRPKQSRALSREEVFDLRNKRESKMKQKRFFLEAEAQLKRTGQFDIHGLALVRFLMHEHPSLRPFDLKKTRIVYVSSSINVIDERLMFDLAYSFVPGFPFESRHLSEEVAQDLKDMFSVVYPDEDYVRRSDLGPQNANCIFLDYDRYHSHKFQKQVLAKFEGNGSIRNNGGVIPHLKVCIVSNANGRINDDTILYVGSHNMTKAAWGRYNRLGTTCYVSNYEMGLIVPPRPGSANKKKEMVRRLGFVYPPVKLAPRERPFMRKKVLKS